MDCQPEMNDFSSCLSACGIIEPHEQELYSTVNQAGRSVHENW
jgi:hypothetical protein